MAKRKTRRERRAFNDDYKQQVLELIHAGDKSVSQICIGLDLTESSVRQYFPKKTCLAQHSQRKLDRVDNELNERPRKVLTYRSPKKVMAKGVALTG